jgi:hypothetical protein
MYAYPVAVEAPNEVAVTKVDWEVVVVAVFDDGPYIDEVIEGIIDEVDDEGSGELVEELDDRTEPLPFGSWEGGESEDELEERSELLVLETVVGERIYISNRFPAPQYSWLFPGQMNEQSVKAAGAEPALMVLPQ